MWGVYTHNTRLAATCRASCILGKCNLVIFCQGRLYIVANSDSYRDMAGLFGPAKDKVAHFSQGILQKPYGGDSGFWVICSC